MPPGGLCVTFRSGASRRFGRKRPLQTFGRSSDGALLPAYRPRVPMALIFIIGRQPWPAIAAADDFDGEPRIQIHGLAFICGQCSEWGTRGG